MFEKMLSNVKLLEGDYYLIYKNKLVVLFFTVDWCGSVISMKHDNDEILKDAREFGVCEFDSNDDNKSVIKMLKKECLEKIGEDDFGDYRLYRFPA